MPDIYDQLLGDSPAAPAAADNSAAAPAASPYDQILDQQQDMERRRLSGVLGEALKANPDQAAQTQKLAQASGLPVDTVERNADEVTRQERLRRTDTAKLLADSPILARQLMDPDFAKVAHDDVERLSGLEKAFRGFGEYVIRPIGGEGVPTLNKGVSGVMSSLTGLAAAPLDSLTDWGVLPENPLRNAQGFFDQKAAEAEAFRQSYGVQAGLPKGQIGLGIQSGIASLWQSLLFAPAGIEEQGGQVVNTALQTLKAAGPMGAVTGGGAYVDARQAGLNETQATLYGLTQGMLETGTEMIPFGKFLEDVQMGSPLWKTLGKQLVTENLSEQAATHLQDLTEWAALHPEQTFGDYLAQRPDAALQTLVATTFATGLQTTALHTLTRHLQPEESAPLTDFASNLQRAQQAEQTHGTLSAIADLAAQSNLRERMPERFQQVVQQLKERNGIDQVFVPAEAVKTLFQAQQLSPEAMAQIAQVENFHEAQALNADIAIPIEQLLTHVPAEDVKALLPNMKLQPGDMTLHEANAFTEQARQRAEAFLKDAATAPDTSTSQQVYEDVLGQLIGMGRDRSTAEQEATLYKQVFNAIASRTGQDPLALYQRYQLRINRQQADILSQRPNVDHLDPLLDALRADRLPSEGDIFGKSLLSSLAEAGGLAPDAELTARDAGKARPGLIRNDGMTLDAAREWAQQNGYLTEAADLNAFIDLVDQELRGQPTYAMGKENAGLMRFRDAAQSLRSTLDGAGIDLAQTDNAGVKKALGAERVFNQSGRSSGYSPEELQFLVDSGILTPEQAATYQQPAGEAAYQHGQEILESRLEQWHSAVALDGRGGSGLVPQEWAEPSRYASERGAAGYTAQAKEGRAEQERLIAAAQQHGFFFDDNHPLFDALTAYKNEGGAEHDAYIVGEPQSRVVIRSTIKGSFGNTSTDSPVQYLQRLADYNQTFPDLQTRLIGVSQREDGTAVIWTAQTFVPGEEYASQSDLDAAMRAHGWFEVGTNTHKYRHKETGAVIEDVHRGNVLHIGDELFPIDVIVDKKPAASSNPGASNGEQSYFQDGDYRGNHRAPGPGRGASLDDLTSLYGDEIYSKQAAEYFGHFGGGDALDKATARLIKSLRGKPDAEVTIYRAVPADLTDNTINPGDWVTINRDYAVDHGEGALEGKYRILEKTVKARDLYTNGDSIHEFGYAPSSDTTLYQFAGPKARTANVGTLEEAKARLAKGEFPGRVRRETGWFKGVDGKWRFEIPDDEARFIEPPISMSWKDYFDSRKQEKFGKKEVYQSDLSGAELREYEALLRQAEDEYNRRNGRRRLADVLDHPKLFAAYPDLANVVIGFRQSDDFRGAYYPQADLIELNVDRTPEEMLSTLLHEVQHAIQHREGFATGGNLDAQFVDSVKAALGDLHNRSQQEAEQWKWQNKYKVDSYKEAAQVARYGLMYESAQRLIDYANRESPSGVLRLIRNEIQWIYAPELRDNDVANEIGREFYMLPKRHKMRERNQFLSDLSFKAGRMLLDHIPAEYREQFKNDTRTMKGMLKSLQREAERKNRELKPLHDLQKKARAAAAVAEEHRFSGPFDIYQSLAGEVEARNTQARQKMTEAERRDTAPKLTQDVPDERIVVMFGGRDIQAPMTMASTIGEGADGKPVATLKGTEIAPADADLKALRQAAADYYQQHLAGHAFHNDTLGDINFAKRGLKKAIATSANPAKLRLFAALPDLLQHGRYLGAQPNTHLSTHPSIKAYHRIAGTVMLGDSPVEVQVTVEEHNDGKFYYNHTLPGREYFQEEKGRALTSDAIQARGLLPETERQASPEPALPGTGSQLPETSVAPGRDVLNMVLRQEPTKPRGQISFGDDRRFSITLLERADLSTFLHESGHFFLEVMADAAEAENASEQVKADWQTVLNWMGVQSRAEIGTEQHEQWARGFEAYLREGKAPSMELQSAFSRFKAWLTHIYKTLSQLNVKLTPQVREVMDRLVASEEEIARAERPFQPIFATALEAGMTEQEFAVYRKYAERAHQEAGEQVTKRLMAELSREQRIWWREELERLRGEVTTEVNAQPVYQAMEFLQHGRALQGELPEGLAPVKLDREALVQMYGPEFLKRLPRPYVYGKDGVHPDVLAPVFGFDSGDALVMAMVNARPRKALIEAEAKQRMLETHGDLMHDGGLADQAQAAVQNEYRGKVLRAELVAMAKKRREVASAVRQAVAEERKNAAYAERWKDAERKAADAQQREARQAAFDSIPPLETFQKTARDLINGKALRDIRPHLYLVAERKAYGLATEKASKGHYDEAVQAQQQALLNHFLYREATKAMDEAERVYRYFRKLEKRPMREKIGRAGEDYLEQLDGLLAQYEFRRVSGAEIDRRQETLREFAARKLLDNQEVIEVPERMPAAKNYRELTVSELLGIHDLARNIATVALEKFQATIMGKKQDIDTIAGNAADEILAHGNLRPLNKDLTNSVTNALRRSKDFLAAELVRPEMFLELTGSQTLLDVMTTAQDRLAEKNLRLVEIGKRLREAFKIYSAKQRLPLVGELYQKRTLPELNGYTVSKIELLMMALNWGNQDNRTKLIDGRQGWTEAGVQVVLNKYLTQDDWNLVQTVWDEMEALWPEIAALERRTVGLVPAKVEAAAVVTPFGAYRGGYFPIAYDTSEFATGLFYRQSNDEQMSTGYARRYTRNGHTNERVKSTGKPILLDPRVISRHFDQVLHDLYMRETVQDMHKVFSHPDVQEALEGTAGTDLYRAIRPWINRIAGDVQQPGGALTGFLRFGRSAVTAAGLGFNILNSLQNLASIPAIREYVGSKRMAAALTDFTTSPKKLTAQMLEKSVFMRARGNTYHTDIRDATRGLDPASPVSFFKEYAYWLNGKTQFVVDSIAWHAAYQQALDGKAENIPADDDAKAVAYADHVVRQTQGGGQAIDLPQVQSYGELSKALTMFYGYFSTQGNLFYRRARITGRELSDGQYRKAIIGASSTLLITWFIQQLLAEAVMDPPDDDWEKWLQEKSLRVAWFPAQFAPGARDIANYVQNPQYGYSLSPVGGVFESAGRSVLALNKAVHGDDLGRGDYKAIFETLGAPFQLPTRQMERSGEALLLWMTGEDQPTGPVDAFYDFSKGPKRR